MTRLWSQRFKAPVLGSILPLMLLVITACTNQTNNMPDAEISPHYQQEAEHHMQDPGLIPYYHGIKTETTNEHGNAAGEIGMSVYSLIGSSSLHEGGVSSHIQSRLAGMGIEGIKAFVLNDTIILAREDSRMSSNRYDELQGKVLNQMGGMSGKGEPDNGLRGVEATEAEGGNGDNLEQAMQQVKQMFNEHVQILSVTDPGALGLIDRIAAKLHDSPQDASIAADISQLLKLTKNEL